MFQVGEANFNEKLNSSYLILQKESTAIWKVQEACGSPEVINSYQLGLNEKVQGPSGRLGFGPVILRGKQHRNLKSFFFFN